MMVSGGSAAWRSRDGTRLFWMLCGIFVLARYGLLQSSEQVLVWFDSATNADIARNPVFAREFWLGISPPAYPYLMKFFMLGPSDYAPMACCQGPLPGLAVQPIKPLPLMPMELAQFVTDNFRISGLMLVQWGVSVLSWMTLAYALFARLDGAWLRHASVVAVLLLGCETAVVIWDRNVLTESLSISFMVLMSALLVWRAERLSRAAFGALLAVLLVYVNLRVTHFYLLMMVLAWLALGLYRSGRRKRLLALVLVAAVVGVANQLILFQSDRSITPIRSVVSSRIMSPGFEDIRGWFTAQGMPEVPDAVVGQFWYGPYADYPELDRWIHQDASGLYQRYLLTHPAYFFLKPMRRLNEDNESLPDVFTPDLAWQTPQDQAGLDLYFTDAVLWVLLPIGLIVLARRRRRLSLMADPGLAWLGVFLVASGYLMGLVNWHADLVEVNRHVMPSMLQIRIGLLVLLLAALADIESLRGGRSREHSAHLDDSG